MEGGPGKWCESCHTNKGWEPVALLPVAELAALRALQARMDSVGVLPEKHGTPTHQMDIKGCPYCEGWDDGIEAYRNALEGGTR